jgi:hypothetical protein
VKTVVPGSDRHPACGHPARVPRFTTQRVLLKAQRPNQVLTNGNERGLLTQDIQASQILEICEAFWFAPRVI